MNFFVTIPNFCEKQHQLWMLNKCLESLFDVEPEMAGKVIVVDDRSPLDITPIVSKYPVKVLRHRERASYSKMINSSIKAVKSLGGDNIITINNDIEHQSRFINTLREEFERDPLISVVGALLFYPDGRTQHSGVDVDIYSAGPVAMEPYRGTNIFSPPRYVAHTTGAWHSIKLDPHHIWYDQKFPFSYEDIDYCLRIWERDRRVYFTNKIFHVHYESVTRSRKVTNNELVGSKIFRSTHYDIGEINKAINLLNHHMVSS